MSPYLRKPGMEARDFSRVRLHTENPNRPSIVIKDMAIEHILQLNVLAKRNYFLLPRLNILFELNRSKSKMPRTFNM